MYCYRFPYVWTLYVNEINPIFNIFISSSLHTNRIIDMENNLVFSWYSQELTMFTSWFQSLDQNSNISEKGSVWGLLLKTSVSWKSCIPLNGSNKFSITHCILDTMIHMTTSQVYIMIWLDLMLTLDLHPGPLLVLKKKVFQRICHFPT